LIERVEGAGFLAGEESVPFQVERERNAALA
jgi:hypothetical protein